MRSTYYIAVNTFTKYDEEGYKVASGTLVNMLQSVLSAENLKKCTKGSFEICTVEVEVGYEEEQLVGKAVLDYESDNKCTVDKTALSKLLKASGDWPNMKIEKRCVDPVVEKAPPV